MHRRHFMATAALAAAPNILTAAKTAEPPIIVGHGSHRYRVEKDWSKADHTKVLLENCHEMVQASDGRLFLVTDHPKNNVLIYKTDGTLLDHWTLDSKTAHGLTLSREGGVDFLHITMTEGRVVKTTLDGKILWELDPPHRTGAYTADLPYRPTETAIGPDGDIYVIDGYGSQFILRYSSEGKFLGKFGGRSSMPEKPGKFMQAHGIALDTRGPEPLLVCTARIRNELAWFTLDGKHQRTAYYPGAYLSRPVIHGENLYSAVCFGFRQNDYRMWTGRGFILILDKNNKVISCPGGEAPRYENGTLSALMKEGDLVNNGHDVCIDPNEDLYLCQWNSGKVPPYKLHRLKF
jgi:peptidylamidoglycolate lyase